VGLLYRSSVHCLGTFPATLLIAALSLMPTQEDCAWPRLVCFSSVGCTPTSGDVASDPAELPSLELSADGLRDGQTFRRAILDSCRRRFYLSSGSTAHCEVLTPLPFNCPLEILLLTYLFARGWSWYFLGDCNSEI